MALGGWVGLFSAGDAISRGRDRLSGTFVALLGLFGRGNSLSLSTNTGRMRLARGFEGTVRVIRLPWSSSRWVLRSVEKGVFSSRKGLGGWRWLTIWSTRDFARDAIAAGYAAAVHSTREGQQQQGASGRADASSAMGCTGMQAGVVHVSYRPCSFLSGCCLLQEELSSEGPVTWRSRQSCPHGRLGRVFVVMAARDCAASTQSVGHGHAHAFIRYIL